MNQLSRRLVKLERRETAIRHRIVVRYEGPGSETLQQPTQEEMDEAAEVIVVRYVGAKDGRPVEDQPTAEGAP